jgi:hypothetical protein
MNYIKYNTIIIVILIILLFVLGKLFAQAGIGTGISGGGGGSGAITQISKIVLSSPAASFHFASIPGTYNHLYATVTARSAQTTAFDNLTLEFNGDTGTNYSDIRTTSSGAASDSAVAPASAQICPLATANDPANTTGLCDFTIQNYAATTFFKAAFTRGFKPFTGTPIIGLFGYQWNSTAAITDIILATSSGLNFVTGSTAILYGIN